MDMRTTLTAIGAAALVAGCGPAEEPVANRYARQKALIENKAEAIETQVEKDVSAAEARLENASVNEIEGVEADNAAEAAEGEGAAAQEP